MVDQHALESVYLQVRTPVKRGIILRAEAPVDCPAVFRHGEHWYMTYLTHENDGYKTLLAESDDLLQWRPLGPIVTPQPGTWDCAQAGGSVALQRYDWGGPYTLETHDGHYWLSYLGGALTGYETEPLSIGLAHSDAPDRVAEWQRLPNNPVLASAQPDARPFETATLYRSHILRDPDVSLGAPFVMYYNAKQCGPWVERIGLAVSSDMRVWRRLGDGPVVDHGVGISGDPQIARLGALWVMFYFRYVQGQGAWDTFACSDDLVHWTPWDGPPLVAPSEPWDATFAHKPWIIRHAGVVYHYYCAVGDQGRAIAVATSA